MGRRRRQRDRPFRDGDRKSTRLNSSHVAISYAVFCLKKKNKHDERRSPPDGRLGPRDRQHPGVNRPVADLPPRHLNDHRVRQEHAMGRTAASGTRSRRAPKNVAWYSGPGTQGNRAAWRNVTTMMRTMKTPSLSISVSLSITVTCFFFNDTATTEIYTLSLHDALPISHSGM